MKLFSKILPQKWNRILIFNANSKKIEALEADFNFSKKIVRIKKNFQFEAELREEFSSADVLEYLSKIIKGISKNTSLALFFERPFLKSTVSNFSIIREKPNALIDEAELENVILNLAWRLYDQERSMIDKMISASQIEIALVSSRVKDPRIEGKKILNPLGFSGKRVGFVFENTYSRKDFWEELANKINQQKNDLKILVERNLIIDKVFSALEETGVMIEVGQEETKVGILGEFLKNSEVFKWGEENLVKVIAKHFGVSLAVGRELKNRYYQNRLSRQSQKHFQKIIAPEMKMFLEGIDLAVKNFITPQKSIRNIYVSGTLNNLPEFKDYFSICHWTADVFKKRPSFSPYTGQEIFDKINIQVENSSSIDIGNHFTFSNAIAELFLPEPSYQELNKVLKRRIKWLN